ncbi:sprT-like domain-containing protein Spartan [Contarinia nasturtii]|uniref:sprT-like domain-containing protein Spartan n=1 Tax=Contarinia nasturtii TaxID=265458 RepID=UPI0012D41324|nr:sprT-like domain-containing protein Spartan [Contarinia nasturtii]
MSDISNEILNLDDITNIGHPFWQEIDRSPNIQLLCSEFDKVFFERKLEHRVDLRWGICESKSTAGEATWKDGNIKIRLNEVLLSGKSRRTIVEILLHEMIHAYLMITNTENINDCHGVNFVVKMTEINARTGLKIATTHDLKADLKKKFTMWRCQNDCRSFPPYFGFIWTRDSKEPTPDDFMFFPSSICEHRFEKDTFVYDNEVDCVTAFNKFIKENEVKIEATLPQFISKFGYSIIVSDVNNDTGLVEDTVITNEHYTNYDRETKEFIKFEDYLPLDPNHLPIHKTVCMICTNTIANDIVLEHLQQCTGVTFSLDTTESLPIFKIID